MQVYTWAADTPTKLAHRTRAASLPSAIGLQMDASELVRALPEDLAGVVVYIDPPYQDTTGYAHKYPREAVLADAEDLHRRGAVVAISEAVPLADDLGAGWHAVDMSHARTGQKRTNNTPEFLTMNRKPAHVPAKQQSLF